MLLNGITYLEEFDCCSEWHEDPDYREEINIREYPTGKLLEKFPGAERTMPDGQSWILR